MLLHCASLVAADKISVTEATHALLGRTKSNHLSSRHFISSLPLVT